LHRKDDADWHAYKTEVKYGSLNDTFLNKKLRGSKNRVKYDSQTTSPMN
jgi:hypothetical protein